MLTGFPLGALGRRRGWNHKSGLNSLCRTRGAVTGNCGYFRPALQVVKSPLSTCGAFHASQGPETWRLDANFGLQSTTSEQAIGRTMLTVFEVKKEISVEGGRVGK